MQVNATTGENVYPNQMNVDFTFLVPIADNADVYVDVKIDVRALANVYKSAQGIKSKVRIKLKHEDIQGLQLRQNMSCLVKVLLSSSFRLLQVFIPSYFALRYACL